MNEHTQTEALAGLWTYSAAIFALFMANLSTMTAVLGFLLVVLRFTYEVPKAIQALRSAIKRERIK